MSDALACTYAALMLHDANAPIAADKMQAAIAAAGLEVRPTLPILYARFLEKKSVGDLMAAASAAPAAAAPAGGAAPAAAGAAPAKEAAKEESEGDDDMGMDLFD